MLHTQLKSVCVDRSPTAQNFSKQAQPVLQVDAQVTIIDAALKGYLKWLSIQGSDPQGDVCSAFASYFPKLT